MFARAVTMCRRLLGTQSEAEFCNAAVAEERRVWVRHPADLQTTYQAAGGSNGSRLAAGVRDISRGGISLVVNRPFEAGELLSVELPLATDGSTCTVLACVVHTRAESDGEWTLGCTFARELTNDDLQSFGAQRVKPQSPDQRTWMRFPTTVTAFYTRVNGVEQQRWDAQVLNISPTGVGLLVTQPIEVGVLLSVDLHGAKGPGEYTILACVVHVTPRGEGEWALGCNFIRSLSEQDLEALL